MRHIKSKVPVKLLEIILWLTVNQKSIHSDNQETDLVNIIIRFSATSHTPHSVYKYWELNNINLNQLAKISRSKAQFMNLAMTQKLNKFIIDDHFKRLNEACGNLDMKNHPKPSTIQKQGEFILSVVRMIWWLTWGNTLNAESGTTRMALVCQRMIELIAYVLMNNEVCWYF